MGNVFFILTVTAGKPVRKTGNKNFRQEHDLKNANRMWHTNIIYCEELDEYKDHINL